MGSSTLIIGIIASTGTAISMLPQLIKIIQSKKAENISKPMIVILIVSLSVWIAYGALKKDAIIIISNAVSLGINILLLIFSVLYKTKLQTTRHHM